VRGTKRPDGFLGGYASGACRNDGRIAQPYGLRDTEGDNFKKEFKERIVPSWAHAKTYSLMTAKHGDLTR